MLFRSRKFNGRADCGTSICTHNNPSAYSNGMASAGADDAARAPLMSAKPNKSALQKNRMNRADATDMPKPDSRRFSVDLSRFQSQLPFSDDDFCTARIKAFMEDSGGNFAGLFFLACFCACRGSNGTADKTTAEKSNQNTKQKQQ